MLGMFPMARNQNKQESRMAYGIADEALLTVLVVFKKLFVLVAENRYFGKIET